MNAMSCECHELRAWNAGLCPAGADGWRWVEAQQSFFMMRLVTDYPLAGLIWLERLSVEWGAGLPIADCQLPILTCVIID